MPEAEVTKPKKSPRPRRSRRPRRGPSPPYDGIAKAAKFAKNAKNRRRCAASASTAISVCLGTAFTHESRLKCCSLSSRWAAPRAKSGSPGGGRPGCRMSHQAGGGRPTFHTLYTPTAGQTLPHLAKKMKATNPVGETEPAAVVRQKEEDCRISEFYHQHE